MSERFTRLYELQNNLYSEGAPVIVSAGALLKDTQTNNIIVQLKFHSVSATPIKALKVGITAFDIAGKEIEGVAEYQYLDLSIKIGQEFGSNKAVVMPDSVTRSFAIKSITVVMADGGVQSVPMPLNSLPHSVVLQSTLKDSELIKQYKLKTSNSAAWLPQEANGLWQCHCGEWNCGSLCSNCGGKKSIAFAALDFSSLTNEMNARLAEEKRCKAEAEQREEVERQEKARQLAIEEAHRKLVAMKAKKILAIILPVFALVVVFAVWVYPNVIKPSAMYIDALNLLKSGQYDAAFAAFVELGDYKEAHEMVFESQYQKAVQCSEDQLYVDAINAFEKLGNYKDSPERITQLKEVLLSNQYAQAVELFEDALYEDAANEFQALGDYKDSTQKMTYAKYMYACELLQNGSYDEALPLFTQLGTYQDCTEKVVEAQYGYATTLVSKTKYKEARALLMEISEYEDSMSKIIELDAAIYKQEQLDIYNEAASLARTSDFQAAFDKLNMLKEPIKDSEKLKEQYKTILSFVGVWTNVGLKDTNGYDAANRRFHYALIAKNKGGKVCFYFGLVAEYLSDGTIKANISDDVVYEIQENKLVYVGEKSLLQKPQFWVENDILVKYNPEATATNGYYAEAETQKYVRVKR